MPMRVLVTGGAGFVGSHVVERLVADGHDVIALDDLSTGSRDNLVANVPLLVADISDRDALAAACEGQRFDAVVHCAAKTKVVDSVANPELYRRVLVHGTKNVLALAKRSGAETFVNISTGGAMYGETPAKASEKTPPAPESPYGQFKLQAEDFVAMTPCVRTVTLRLANVYGPRQRSDLEGGVISIFVERWLRGEGVTVFGDGTAERDYVYVTDVADAVLSALRTSVTNVYNIGTGTVLSVNDLIASLGALLGAPREITYGPARAGELHRCCLDSTKAARDGLWSPTTPFEIGLARTVDAARASSPERARASSLERAEERVA
jgi:UDP-glucose 4-epimerase